MPLLRPRWTRVLIALLLLFEAAVALLAAAWLFLVASGWTVLAILVAASLAPVCVWPVIAGRWARDWGAAVQAIAVAGTGVFYAVVAVVGSDRARWNAASERGRAQGIAAAIVRCRTFTGATRAEAKRALGRPSSSGGWYVGEVDTAMGPGHSQELFLTYRGGRVTEAWLTYDGGGD